MKLDIPTFSYGSYIFCWHPISQPTLVRFVLLVNFSSTICRPSKFDVDRINNGSKVIEQTYIQIAQVASEIIVQ